MKFMNPILILLAFSLSSNAFGKAQNGMFVNPSLYYFTQEVNIDTENNGGKTKKTFTNLNINFGYGLGNGVTLGAKYYSETTDNTTSLFDYSDESDNQTSAIGPFVGYDFDGFMLMAAYMAIQAPEKTNGSRKYYEGKGYVIDAIYFINMGGWFLGPQLSARNFEYQKYSINGSDQDTFTKLTESTLFPYLAFLVSI